ncbi:MAG: ATP-dependent RNA helicase DeaD [Halieaceae bacterium]|jgi:ATP-dependent RNA helicase DeaD
MSNENNTDGSLTFRDLQLAAPLVTVLEEIGYEQPTPIQLRAIPHLLQGLDLLGHAPTGTGKTAAFALPLLSRIDMHSKAVQVMALTPTRELAIQVAEAFQRYASHIKGFHVLPIYGGQGYGGQISALKRGVQVVVGTPGRVMDHMRKGTLKLDSLQALVLDEADEMLRMGFIEEVEWILEQTPAQRQMALFSATMPKQVERIARRHLRDPQTVSIESKTATADTIRQRYLQVSGFQKLDALTRILEVEPFDAVLIFVRTKTATVDLAERLEARGYSAAAMNGDMIQKQREQMVERLKNGTLDLLVATDVAARGLDVERISHVINFDIPYDAEAYIHRIGRTGRAGREGQAILFVAPRERRMLSVIERVTRQKVAPLVLPTAETVNNKRIADFKQKISDTVASGEIAFMQGLIEQYLEEHEVPILEVAAALAKMVIGDKPLLLKADAAKSPRISKADRAAKPAADGESRGRNPRPQRRGDEEVESECFRLEVGTTHGVKAGNIVGAIANEAGLDGHLINIVEIKDEFSLVELPKGMPKEIFADLKKVRVCGIPIRISRAEGSSEPDRKEHSKKGSGKHRSGKSAAEAGAKKPGKGAKRRDALPDSGSAAKKMPGKKPKKAKS